MHAGLARRRVAAAVVEAGADALLDLLDHRFVLELDAIEAGRVTPADGSFGDEWVNWSPYTYPFNLTQQPAACAPCGFTADGLPIGLQIVGPARGDHLVLRAARAFESARPFATLDAPKQ